MENERLAVVEAQLKWMAPIVERTEMKLDRLIEKDSFHRGKMYGICIIISALVGIGVDICRAFF